MIEINYTPAERDAYEESLKHYRDIKNIVDTSREEGFEEGLEKGFEKGLKKGLKKGLEEGLEKGRKEERDANVKNGIKKGYSNEIIADITGRSIVDIQQIRAKMENE